ncbi:hypothetical protein OA88_08705 [Flavobacterium sp. JRM]|nr:hypothetical protein OA88_08705 [Flavobacterium sp. JRM]
MKYSSVIFGKDLYNLTYLDLENFFLTQKEENLNLEFKSYAPQGIHRDKENVIKKSVCSLLNSEGGIVIWGAPIETRHPNGNTTAIGGLTPFNAGLDRDRLINILSSSIIPMPIGIRVQFLNDGNDNFIVVIEVEKSIERPHQHDNRYYIRLDGQTRVAPHYLIKALIQSKDFPVLRGHVRLKNIQIIRDDVFLTFRKLLFNSSQFNNEKNAFMKIVTLPGEIYINRQAQGDSHSADLPILSHGRPSMSNFVIKLNVRDLPVNLKIVFQFGGEKSPSKISNYKYNINANLISGDILNDNIYLVEKDENSLPAIDGNDDDTINNLLNV